MVSLLVNEDGGKGVRTGVVYVCLRKIRSDITVGHECLSDFLFPWSTDGGSGKRINESLDN